MHYKLVQIYDQGARGRFCILLRGQDHIESFPQTPSLLLTHSVNSLKQGQLQPSRRSGRRGGHAGCAGEKVLAPLLYAETCWAVGVSQTDSVRCSGEGGGIRLRSKPAASDGFPKTCSLSKAGKEGLNQGEVKLTAVSTQ